MPEYLAVVRSLSTSPPVRLRIAAAHLDEARKFMAARCGMNYHSTLYAYDLHELRESTEKGVVKSDWVVIDQRFAPGENDDKRPVIKTEPKPVLVSNYERSYKDYELVKVE